MTFLLLETLHPEAVAALEGAGKVVLAEDPDEAVEVAEREKVEAILTRGRGQIRARLLDASPALRVVARAGVGLDNVDVAGATERGIRVINAPGSTTVAVAEHTLLLIAALVRGLYRSVTAVKAGDWESRRSYEGDDLAGKRLGLLGMGQIARRVAALAEAYEMEVAYWNRSEKRVPYALLPLDRLLATSDVISLHLALTPETRGLIGEAELGRMKPGSCLVNTARGALVDQRALSAALAGGRLAGFAADVLDPEPPAPDEPLLRSDRAIITPHTAALTGRTYREICLRTARNVVAAVTGGEVEPGCVANEAHLSTT